MTLMFGDDDAGVHDRFRRSRHWSPTSRASTLSSSSTSSSTIRRCHTLLKKNLNNNVENKKETRARLFLNQFDIGSPYPWNPGALDPLTPPRSLNDPTPLLVRQQVVRVPSEPKPAIPRPPTSKTNPLTNPRPLTSIYPNPSLIRTQVQRV
eukprot:1328115-Rhodomonas_salina.4